jgi:prevent-host-death family protein
MKTMSAKDAKNAFGMMIDLARAEPLAIEKHGRKVVVVVAVEEYDRLRALENGAADRSKRQSKVEGA